jgi:hypothetical protein
MWVDFNANDNVKVRLTEAGEVILVNYYGGTIPLWFAEHHIDEDGWYIFQFHELSHIFGQYLYNGNPRPPFEMNMKIEIKEDK